MAIERDIINDKKLVEHCLADKRQYQEILYRRFADRMFTISLTYADNDDDACDILQEGFIRVFRNLKRFRFECALEGWVRRIIVNVALEHYRKKKREREVLEDYKVGTEQLAQGILEKINAGELVRLVNELPSKAAMVLKLYAIDGYAHKEIATLMGISEGTSKSQLNRARSLLRESMNRNNGR